MNPISSATTVGVAARYAAQLRELIALHHPQLAPAASASAVQGAQKPPAQSPAQQSAASGSNLNLRV